MNRRMKTLFIIILGGVLMTAGIKPPCRAASGALSLDECIQAALENNPGLQVADEEKAVRAEDVSLARSAFWPQVDAVGGYTRFSDPMRVIPAHENNEPGVFDRNLLETGLILRLSLYQGGRRWAELSIARLGRERSVEIWKTTRQDLILNLHSFFYKILQLDEVEHSAEISIKALKAHHETASVQLEVGRAAPVDIMKIDVRLSEIEQRLSTVRADRRALIAGLSQLMGPASADSRLCIRGELKAVPEALPDMEAAHKTAETLRPELAAARLALKQAEAAVQSARAAFYPQVEGVGSYGFRSAVPYDDAHEDAWAAGVRVSLPLFHGGANLAKLRRAEIRKQQSVKRLQAVKLQIETDLKQTMARLTDSMKRMDVNRKNTALSRETFRIEQAKNEDGKNSINDLLDAQAAMLLAEVAYSQSVMDYLLARVEWRRAVGTPLRPEEKE